jgi:hypothetical protein
MIFYKRKKEKKPKRDVGSLQKKLGLMAFE